jgi:hypothetical protein
LEVFWSQTAPALLTVRPEVSALQEEIYIVSLDNF